MLGPVSRRPKAGSAAKRNGYPLDPVATPGHRAKRGASPEHEPIEPRLMLTGGQSVEVAVELSMGDRTLVCRVEADRQWSTESDGGEGDLRRHMSPAQGRTFRSGRGAPNPQTPCQARAPELPDNDVSHLARISQSAALDRPTSTALLRPTASPRNRGHAAELFALGEPTAARELLVSLRSPRSGRWGHGSSPCGVPTGGPSVR